MTAIQEESDLGKDAIKDSVELSLDTVNNTSVGSSTQKSTTQEDSELEEVADDISEEISLGDDLYRTSNSNDDKGISRGSRRVSFGPRGQQVAYTRRTSNLDNSITIAFGTSEEIGLSERSKQSRSSDFHKSCVDTETKSSELYKSMGFRTNFASKTQPQLHENFRISKNPTLMKLERIEAYFYNHGMEIALGVLYLALNMLVAAHGAYQFSSLSGWIAPNPVLAWTLPIARAGGRLVTLNCAILLLTACKYLWTLVRTYVAPVVPIGFPIDEIMPKYHRYVALTIIFSGCVVHTLPQIVNYATKAITMDPKGFRFWTLGDGFATTQLLITGTLLAIIFSTFFLTTLQSFRKTTAGFRWFWTFHVAGIATAYPLLLIHGTCRGHPVFLYFALLPLALYILDVSMRRKSIYSAEVLRWKVHDDDGQQITELVLKRPKCFSYTPGQYAELKFAPISTREWHPFTIASSPGGGETKNDEVAFYIKNSGRWTGALMDFAAAYDLSKAREATKILLRGPHGAPAMNYAEYKHILVIGSGVGVTPLLSIWNYLLDKGKESAASRQFLEQHTTTPEGEGKRTWRRESMNMMEQKSTRIMKDSVSIFHQSMDVSANLSRSRRFLMNFSQSRDLFGSHALPFGSFDIFEESFERMLEEKIEEEANDNRTQVSSSPSKKSDPKFRARCIFLALFLESMMVSLPIFVLFVLGGTVSIYFQMIGWYLAANTLASSLSVIALMVHGIDVVVWTIVAGRLYFQIFKGWLESVIFFVNGLALWYSIRGCMLARQGEIDAEMKDFRAVMISIGFVIVLQATRIFHIFYRALKVQTPHRGDKTEEEKRASLKMDNGAEFFSVNGIVVNRKYANMKFAARCILPQILQEGLSDVFSMEFYGTREKPKKTEHDEEMDIDKTDVDMTEHSLVGEMMGSMGFNIDVKKSIFYSKKAEEGLPQEDFFLAGRPDWNHIFLKAISKAHATNEEGESVGCFFCGSPAIAHALQLEANKVTAQHQFAMKCLNGKRCRCKIIVHSENF